MKRILGLGIVILGLTACEKQQYLDPDTYHGPLHQGVNMMQPTYETNVLKGVTYISKVWKISPLQTNTQKYRD